MVSVPALSSSERPKTRFPRAWVTYGLCLAEIVISVGDALGWRMGFLSFLMALVLLVAVLVNLVAVIWRWRRSRWLALLPVVFCLAAVPAGSYAHWFALRARLTIQRSAYDEVADALCAGKRVQTTITNPLGYWAGAIHADHASPDYDPDSSTAPIVAAHFLTVSHGYAGHQGYLRLCDRTTTPARPPLPRSWRNAVPLDLGWYLVSD